MVATQSAGWTGTAHWRNLVIAYLGLVAGNGALVAGLNAVKGTHSVPSEPYVAILASAPELAFLVALILPGARKHGLQMARSRSRVPGADTTSEESGGGPGMGTGCI